MVATLLLSGAACAQQLEVSIDPARSTVNWVLAGNVHTVHGTFRWKQGHVLLNTATSALSGELVTDARSAESGNPARDKRMHKDTLESERYPDIRLVLTKWEGLLNRTGNSSVRVNGALFIHGSSHEVTLPVELALTGSEVRGTSKFSIPYVDWGMKDPSNFLFKVDKSVEVEIVAVGKLTAK